MKKKKSDAPFSLVNKKAKFNFELLEFMEAGIMLKGSEVKSLRGKKGNLTDGFAKVKKGEVFLENLHIPAYINGGYANHAEVRPRKLLLSKKQIIRLERQVKEKGLVLVATKLYFKNNKYVKIELATGKPKKLHDKRETLQKRDAQLEIQKALKQRNRY